MEAEAWRPRCQAIRAIPYPGWCAIPASRELPAACHRHAAGKESHGAKLGAQQRFARYHDQTTGEVSRDPTVKKMNEDEKAKVETKGK